MNNFGVDITADPVSFKEQVIKEYGEFYYDQSGMFFERASYFATEGFLYNAIQDAMFAYSLGQYEPYNYGIIYIIGLLTQLYLDTGQITKAKSYCELGFKMLDPGKSDYEDDLKAFQELREMIKGSEWKQFLE